MKKSTREWVRKAEADFRAGEQLQLCVPPVHDVICFHAQQAAEKYLKALREEHGLSIPRIHDLLHLLADLLPHHPTLGSLRRGLLALNDFGVDARYPGQSLTKRDAQSALRWARRIRDACRDSLGIRPRKKSP
jgi:HEPN domain-containing protein